MVSIYGVITVANLESKSGYTYDTVDARYTDTVVEYEISDAERFIYAIKGSAPSSAIPTDVLAVGIIAERAMFNKMIHDGHSEKDPIDLYKDIDKMYGSAPVMSGLTANYGKR